MPHLDQTRTYSLNYFELLNLRREPFSHLPAPEELFYASKQHQECLRSLEIGIWLRRGLNVVTGNVGTGKTTLCGKLMRMLKERPDSWTHLIADPFFNGRGEFLMYLNKIFGVSPARSTSVSNWQLRENLKDVLTRMVVEKQLVVTLIVDEGQKLSPECLEVLRDLLNFELDEHNLLQIVVFGQLEFAELLASQANIFDRVNRHLRLGPLGFDETCALIKSRIVNCAKDAPPKGLFSFGSLVAIYLATDGYPRRIMQLCHQSILSITLKGQSRVTWQTVRRCARWRELVKTKRVRWSWMVGLSLVGAVVLVGWSIGAKVDVARFEKPAFLSRLMSGSAPSVAPPEVVAPDGAKSAHVAVHGTEVRASLPPSSPPAKTAPVADHAPEAAVPPPSLALLATPAALAENAAPVAASEASATGSSPAREIGPTPPALESAPAGPPRKEPGPLSMTPAVKEGAAVPLPNSAPAAEERAPAASVAPAAPAAPVPPTVPAATNAPASTADSAPSTASSAAHVTAAESFPSAPPAPSAPSGLQAAQVPAGPPQSDGGAPESGKSQFLGINLSEEDNHTVVDIFTSSPVSSLRTSFSDGPPRFFVDLMGEWERQGAKEFRANSPRVEKIRNMIFPNKLRVEIFLSKTPEHPGNPVVETTPNGLRLKVK